jgi:hypothetical protein
MSFQSSLDTANASVFATLVTFTWGNGNIVRYCRWTSDISIGGVTFTSAPEMSVEMEKSFNGGTSDTPMKIKLRMIRPPVNDLSEVFPHATVSVLIEELSPLDPLSRREVFLGTVREVKAQPGGTSQLAELQVVGIKTRFGSILSLQLTTTCQWTFGKEKGSPCEIDAVAMRLTGEAVLNWEDVLNRVRVVFDPMPVLLEAERWRMGYMERDGCRITILKVNRTNDEDFIVDTFDLAKSPPPSWEGMEVTLTPGCSKTISNCRYWNNETRFGGFGIATPGYHPVYEKGNVT